MGTGSYRNPHVSLYPKEKMRKLSKYLQNAMLVEMINLNSSKLSIEKLKKLSGSS
jgi:hypothetical protein